MHLKDLNDDYAVERKSALKEITVTVLKENYFMEFMQSLGKIGGQHKFPRVLKEKCCRTGSSLLQTELYNGIHKTRPLISYTRGLFYFYL